MKWFLNLSTRAKLFFSFGLLILFLASAVLAAYRGIREIRNSQSEVQRQMQSALSIRELRSNQNGIRANLLTMSLLTERREQEALETDIKARSEENDESLRTLQDLEQANPSFLSKLEEFNSIRTDYKQTRDNQEIPLINEGKREEALKLAVGIQQQRTERMRTIADELVKETGESVQRVVTQSEQTADRSIRVFLSVGFLALLVSIAMGASLNRIIANPLKDISSAAEKIAAGDVSVVVPSNNRRDEVGALAQAFGGMIRSLQEKAAVAGQISAGNLKVQVTPQSEKDVLGNAFASMVKNLSEVTREIREGVNVLASSASEILASTTQVASGAAETATAVSQTTSTVEEVKQTAQVSSQKAKYVSESAQKSGQVSQTGKKAVEDTVAAMNRIREQVDSIAESIVRLSEQSQAIGEIIATVNDLAEQSNLLAVNASIEAAKAGEQGKGFAVVAQEVRSLAEQSKQATAQVRGILGDIQKATSAAVMATEQGSKAVEAGVAQSTETGESIRVLADSIAEAAQAATQIAASAQQQLVGMDQVALAMENIKQASTQNVASTKQAETAAQNLHDLGQKLKRLVEQYQV